MRTTTVLLVEDDADNRSVVSTLLEVSGFRVLEGDSGEAALDLVRGEPPDVILMDLTLPGIDGWAATERIGKDPATAHIPIIPMSGDAGPEARERARSLGCAGFLAKPFQAGELLEAIQRAVG